MRREDGRRWEEKKSGSGWYHPDGREEEEERTGGTRFRMRGELGIFCWTIKERFGKTASLGKRMDRTGITVTVRRV
jgi:hypothetical protein